MGEDLDHKLEQPVVLILLGNKSDLNAERKVSDKEIEEYVKQEKFIGWFPCSAATNSNIANAFKTLAEHLLQNSAPVKQAGIKLDVDDTPNDEKKKCCSN